MRCAFVGRSDREGRDSPLWKGGVGGRYTDVELRVLRIDLRLGCTSGRGPLEEMRKGLLMVVTRMACLSSALSETSVGKKLTSPSKGRWEGSAAGSDICRARPSIFADNERGRPAPPYGSR